MIRELAKRVLPASAIDFALLLQRDERIRRMLAGQELDACLAAENLIPSDGIVVDVGAERGQMTLHFARLGFRVIAFEPSRSTALALRLRAVRYRRVSIRECACGAQSGTAHIDESGPSWARHLGSSGRPVRQVRLADVLPTLPVALLKVDAEGGDLDVLRGYFVNGRPLPKATMFEWERGSLGEPLDLLRQAGYRHFRFICRWNEEPDVTRQPRLAVFDGHDPMVDDATWGNAIASTVGYRVQYPLAQIVP